MAKKTKDHVLLEEDFKRQQKMLKLGIKLLYLRDEFNSLVEKINRLALEPRHKVMHPIIGLEKIESDPVEMIFNYLHDVRDKFERFDDNPEACNKWFKFVSRIIVQTDSEQSRRRRP